MFINANSEKKSLKNNILALSKEALDAKKHDDTVINATAGTLKSEDGSLYVFPSVERAMRSLSTNEKYAYANSAGSPEYNNAVIHKVFGKYVDDIKKTCYLESIPTPGGTGALNLAFTNYVNRGETVLLPNHMWENYLNCAKEMEFIPETFLLFNEEGRFNIEDISKHVKEIKKHQKRIMMLINDPCENPTGFCMKDEDYDHFIGLARENPDTDFVFLVDVAYFDFYSTDTSKARSRFAKFKDMPNNAIALFTFSGSKSFGLYGFRIGSLLIMTKDSQEAKAFIDANNFSCRVKWSSASISGMNIITKLVLNEEYRDQYNREIKTVVSMLEERSLIFIKEAKEVGLTTLPYERGFFICVPVDNPDDVRKKLHEDKVYLISTKNCLRIALCSVTKSEAKRLPKIIKERLSNI